MKNMENNSLNFDFNDGVLRVAIVGEINHHNAVFVRQEIDEKVLELCPKNLVLDLADTPFIDSSGLGLIMGRYSLMKDLGGKLVLKDPTLAVMRILSLAGMERLIKIEKTDKEEVKK